MGQINEIASVVLRGILDMSFKNPGFHLVWMACVLWAVPVCAQEDPLPERPDLSNPDLISYPPMDPYSLSFVPPKPDGVMNIVSPSDCQNAGGKWGPSADMIYSMDNDELVRVGCSIRGDAQGRWVFVKQEKSYQDIQSDKIYGYVWQKDNLQEGWSVILNAPNEFTRKLTSYSNGVLDGTEFVWNEMGALEEVTTYKNGVRSGKFERYLECLPTALGQYEDGKPAGKWDIFEEPGMISMRRYYDRKALQTELPEGMPANTEAYWTEWFNGDGVKIVEGYSVSDYPELEGIRVGKIQLFTTAGNPWLKINYDATGNANDQPTFDLCKPEDNPKAPIPAYLDYDHDEKKVLCKNSVGNVYREIYFYGTGEKWKTVPLQQNVIDGVVHEYHPSGELLAKYTVKKGVPDGVVSYLTKEGTPMGEPSTIIAGMGHFKSWWYNGYPREEGKYSNGEKTGLWKTWYDTGSLESERMYKGGVLNGVSKVWFSNGVLSSEVHYLLGTRHGLVTAFYTDGHVAYRYNFKQDRAIGMCYDYTHAGQVAYDTNYTDHGPYEQTRYYTDGSKLSSGKMYPGFGDAIRQGEWKFYLKKSDTPWYTAVYDSNEIVSDDAKACSQIRGEYKIDEERREIGCKVCAVNRENPLAMYHVREAQWMWYNENGTLEKRGSIHLGHMNGIWEYYYPNGKLMLKGEYLLDRRIGNWTGYYENGGKKFDGRYENGVESGHWSTYHAQTGSISSEGEFANGKRNGEWKWYYPDGSLHEKGVFADGKETGTWTQFYPDGKKKGEGEFIEGLREGQWTWWRSLGEVWKAATYVKGKENDLSAH